MKTGLTPLEARFCAEYIVDFVASYALKRAGSKAKYLDQQASEMMKKPHILAEIERRLVERNQAAIERGGVNRQWVLIRLVMEYERASAAANDPAGQSRSTDRGHALKALDKIGQHVDVNAFRQQIGLGNPDGSNFDYSALSDEELHDLERILSKAALGTDPDLAGAPGGAGSTLQ